MTHAAKGLEFDVVLPGWEEGYFLIKNRCKEKGDFALEEEELAYVGITRAKRRIFFETAYQGDWMEAIPSNHK